MHRTLFMLALVVSIPSAITAQPATFQRGIEASQRGDWPAAIEAYRAHLAAHPKDAWGYYALGSVLHGTGEFAAAAEAYEAALAHQVSVPAVVHYNLACSKARGGDLDSALESLAVAVSSGLFSGESILADPDFTSLRDRPRFAELARQGDLAFRPCVLREPYRQLDFWIGTWDVRIQGGFRAGINRVERSEDGCVLTQTWEGVFGTRGRSWTVYDAARDLWTQTWVGRNGVVATAEGRLEGDAMVLVGPGASGPRSRSKTRWAPATGGKLTVTTWTSEDAGVTWSQPTVTEHIRTDGREGEG